MNKGLLWFDNDPHTDLAEKVLRAEEFYFRKYGRHATCCYFNAHIGELPPGVENIRLIASSVVLPNHYWLGEESVVSPG